jgi:serine protease Do
MFAFPAAKRTFVLLMSIALLVTVVVAQAGEEKGYLGVKLQELTPSMAKALQMDDQSGVMINEIVDDSPAEKAGLKDGDVILEFNGKNISDNDDLVKAVRGTSPGETVEVVVLRDGKNKNLEVEIGKHEDKSLTWVFDDDDMHDSHFEHYGDGEHKVIVMSGSGDDDFVWSSGEDMAFGFDDDRGYMGVNLDDLNEQMGEYFGVEDGKGALVTEVVEDSPAAKAGLKAGDVIVRLGEKEIDSSSALHKAVADTEPEQQMSVKVMRKGQSKDMSITLGEVPEGSFSKRIEFIGEDDDHFTVHAAPRMSKHFGHGGDVDVRVIRRGAPHGEVEFHELKEMQEAEGELKEMREELHKMQQELKEMQEELKKK